MTTPLQQFDDVLRAWREDHRPAEYRELVDILSRLKQEDEERASDTQMLAKIRELCASKAGAEAFPAAAARLRHNVEAVETGVALRETFKALGWTPPDAVLSVVVRQWGQAYPRMSIHSEPGTPVVFDGMGGFEREVELAMQVLVHRGLYRVERVEIDSFSSTVKLEGVPGEFNTVMFAQTPVSSKEVQIGGLIADIRQGK